MEWEPSLFSVLGKEKNFQNECFFLNIVTICHVIEFKTFLKEICTYLDTTNYINWKVRIFNNMCHL